MPDSNLRVRNKRPLPISASPASHARVTNAGPDVVYYKAGSDVSAESNEGELGVNESLDFEDGTRWFLSAGGSRLFVAYTPEATTDMATQAELDAVSSDGASTAELEAHEADTTDIHGIADTSALLVDDLTRAPWASVFYANFVSENAYEFAEEQANDERIDVTEDGGLGRPVCEFKVVAGDPLVASGQRAELIDQGRYDSGDEAIFSYRFKLIEVDWSKWQIVLQLHDEEGLSPPVAILCEESEGKRYVWIGPGDSSATWWKLDVTGAEEQWIDLVFRVKFHETEGEFEVRKDGVLQTLEDGSTAMTGLTTVIEGNIVSKIGIYRSKEATGTARTRVAHFGAMKRTGA